MQDQGEGFGQGMRGTLPAGTEVRKRFEKNRETETGSERVKEEQLGEMENED